MTKMWHKDYGDVDVYEIKNVDNKLSAICFIPAIAGQQDGQGWMRVKMSKLIPYPHAEIYKTGQSKTQRNKIKSMLKLTYAEWTCTDGTVFDNEHLDDAIQYQAKLMEDTSK